MKLSDNSLVLAASTLLMASTALAHLPAYEGQRVRNDNHFAKDGFAQPVAGACDFFGNGPTDPNLGSANIYLGNGNNPPNFFCLYTSQDDWSFSAPANIIESTRTPSPSQETLGLELEEGYIPCDPLNRDPFQCPREMKVPRTGNIVQLPGQCIDGANDAGPADNKYHCAILPGSPRPRTSGVLFSTLVGPNDVDWAVYDYKPVYGQQPIVGASQVPACRENLNSFVSFAYAGPLDMVDARSGEQLFQPLAQYDLPQEIRSNLPAGYGIRLKRPVFDPISSENPRMAYASGYAQNGWLLAPGSVIECIDQYEKCIADKTGELSKHYINNDIFFVEDDQDRRLYLMWWVDHESEVSEHILTDVSVTTGVIDQFQAGDYMNVAVTGPFSANGRYIHGQCSDPRPSGLVNMIIETN